MSSASSLDQVTNVERFGFSASSCDLRAKLPLRMDTYELYAQNTLHKTDSSVLNALRILMLLSPIRMLRFAGNMRNEPQQITAFVQDGHGMTVHGYGCLHLCEKTLTREHSLRICYAAGSLVLTITLDSEPLFRGAKVMKKFYGYFVWSHVVRFLTQAPW